MDSLYVHVVQVSWHTPFLSHASCLQNKNGQGLHFPAPHSHSRLRFLNWRFFITLLACSFFWKGLEGGVCSHFLVHSFAFQAFAFNLAAGIASGMLHLHDRNVIHGDLNPANVLLKSDCGRWDQTCMGDPLSVWLFMWFKVQRLRDFHQLAQ